MARILPGFCGAGRTRRLSIMVTAGTRADRASTLASAIVTRKPASAEFPRSLPQQLSLADPRVTGSS